MNSQCLKQAKNGKPMTEETTAVENAETTDSESTGTETVDYWKSQSRRNEARSKENKSALDKLTADFNEAKQELDRWKERETGWNTAKADFEKANASATNEALKLKAALKHGLSFDDIDFLKGETEEELDKLATRLATPISSRMAPNPDQGKTSKKSPSDSLAEELRGLFS